LDFVEAELAVQALNFASVKREQRTSGDQDEPKVRA
jgi:hypothetical protein